MLKQVLISLLVLIAAAVGYVLFVPGADATLQSLGINLSVPGSVNNSAAGKTGTKTGAVADKPGAPRGGGGGGGGRQRAAPTVITAPVVFTVINDKLTAIGEAEAAQSVTVTAQASGTLTKVLIAPGDTVKAGQTIAELDAQTQQIAFDKAKLAAKDADDALTRTKTLAKSNSATQVQLSTAQLADDNANLAVKSAELDLTKRTITTPIDGIVGLIQITPGNAVTATSVLTTVDDSSSVKVNYWVPERYAPALKVGMPAMAEATALPGQIFTGTVAAIDSRIDPASRTLQVQATIPNPDGKIKPGMSFSVTMAFPGQKFAAVDPLAIQWAADGPYVWKYDNGKVKKANVQIVQRDSDGVLVDGTLAAGDQVVTQGILQLADGERVDRIDANPTTTPADTAAQDTKSATPQT